MTWQFCLLAGNMMLRIMESAVIHDYIYVWLLWNPLPVFYEIAPMAFIIHLVQRLDVRIGDVAAGPQ